MKVLVTGGAGYIGSILVRDLLQRGYDVTVLDRVFFGEESLKDIEDRIKLIREDTRSFNPDILRGISVVVDLAAIGQPDAAGILGKEIFHNINYNGSVRVAKLSKKYGVERYIFASTCSVYGFQNRILKEDSELMPLEAYTESKIMAENEIATLKSREFCTTILRFATAYGLSHKMRFDLVINAMVLSLYKTGKIMVMRPGTQCRPVVHVKDTVKAIRYTIESEKDLINGEVFNVGSNEQNYKILELAKLIGDSIRMDYEIEWYGEPDKRSYVVDFSKIAKTLNYKTDYTPKDGALEIYKALSEERIKETMEMYTIRWFKNLMDLGIVKVEAV